jgi:Flp pilus assembly CpaF family ATPase
MENNLMAFIKRSEAKIVSIVDTEELDEKQKEALLIVSKQLQDETQKDASLTSSPKKGD